MFDRIKSLFFGEGDAAGRVDLDGVRLAAAALLVEAAMADGSMAATERDSIGRLLRQRFDLSDAAAEALFQEAWRRQQAEAQLFPFVRVIVDRSSEAQRIELLEMLWEVAYADGHLHDYESSLVRQVAGLLYVSDQSSGLARQRALAKLGLSDDPAA